MKRLEPCDRLANVSCKLSGKLLLCFSSHAVPTIAKADNLAKISLQYVSHHKLIEPAFLRMSQVTLSLDSRKTVGVSTILDLDLTSHRSRSETRLRDTSDASEVLDASSNFA